MPKAKINFKNGTTVIINGSKEDVAKILSDLERMRTVEEIKKQSSAEKKKNKEIKKRATASDLIIELKEEGFFDKPRTLSEVVKALENYGYIYPATTLSAVVLNLVQKKLLRRKETGGKWTYGK